ncbi:50S ribosomal protein L23 [Chlorobium sp.]|jgi:large subunit ribosomal protein L23|uniref:50S ribosomal protein L23 n=1 Tax=Chlorobium sp. TaxID=1095 RepID=UPI003C441B2E|nr:50S ribosomal protein L23 [Chlorobiaceae bacterium]NTW93779.1 50S ribosomal protein L23 [Chlorobiaceae bacterium]
MKNPLLRPWLTEKSTGLTEKKGQYVFVVKPDADKIDIRNAVQNKFGVTVTSVRTVNCLGKAKRQYTRKGLIAGKKSDWKKAIVTLADGQSIDYYSGSAQKGEG